MTRVYIQKDPAEASNRDTLIAVVVSMVIVAVMATSMQMLTATIALASQPWIPHVTQISRALTP